MKSKIVDKQCTVTNSQVKRVVRHYLAVGEFEAAKNILTFQHLEHDESLCLLYLRVLLLLGDVDKAIVFYESLKPKITSMLFFELVNGLLSNFRFSYACELLMRGLKEKFEPEKTIDFFAGALVHFYLYDECYALLEKAPEYTEMVSLPLLLKLAIRLQMIGHVEQSYYILSKYLQRSQEKIPMAVPWLLAAHDKKSEANRLLNNDLATCKNPQKFFNRHLFYLQAEYRSLFDALLQQCQGGEQEQVLTSNFEALLDGTAPVKPMWNRYENSAVWRYSWQFDGKSLPISQYFIKKAQIAALNQEEARLLSYAPEFLVAASKYTNNIREVVLPALPKDGQPYIFVSSHAISPGALFLLMQVLPDLYYLRTAAIANNDNYVSRKAIKAGPNFMFKHNLGEMAKLNKLLMGGSQFLLTMDLQRLLLYKPQTDSVPAYLVGDTKFQYDFFLSPLIWEQKIKCYWLDVIFENKAFKFSISELPDAKDFEQESQWQGKWLSEYHAYIKSKVLGQNGLCNPVADFYSHMMLSDYANDLSKIYDIIQHN
jgi:hypothetical protein